MYTSQVCYLCKEDKPLAEFRSDKHRFNGHKSLCRRCHNLDRKERRRKYLRDAKGKSADYEINREGYCAICGDLSVKLIVDHKHGTDEMRGMLCRACNCGLGFFRDDIERLARAIEYLVSSNK